jgi:nitrogen fixation NifU-like protein
LDSRTPDLDILYRDVVLDHYRTPRGRAGIPDPDVTNEGVNPLCGDEVSLALKFDGGSISKVHVHGRGCSISVASGSMLAELLAGMPRAGAERTAEAFRKMMHGEDPPAGTDMGDLEALKGVKNFPVRIKCAMLPWTTFMDALRAYDKGHPKAESPTTTETGGENS